MTEIMTTMIMMIMMRMMMMTMMKKMTMMMMMIMMMIMIMMMKDYTVAHHIGVERPDIPSIVATTILPGVVARPVSRDPDLNPN